jgi:hypothetical protein
MGQPFKPICPRGHDKRVTGYTKSSRKCVACRLEDDRERRTGCTAWEYQALLKLQNNKCIGCKRTDVETGQRLHVDHDHKTGKIRGLLFRHCNLAIGNAQDSTEVLMNLIEYLLLRGSEQS